MLKSGNVCMSCFAISANICFSPFVFSASSLGYSLITTPSSLPVIMTRKVVFLFASIAIESINTAFLPRSRYTLAF